MLATKSQLGSEPSSASPASAIAIATADDHRIVASQKCPVRATARLYCRVRLRRADFAHQRAHELTTAHGLVAVENLSVRAMTRSAMGTVGHPGRNVRQKAGLNRAILDKAWGGLLTALRWHGRKNGCAVVTVPPAFTSQTCSACGHVAAESRESQARFRCVACGFEANADVNAARVILGAGLALTGRGDLGVARSTKRQPPERLRPCAANGAGIPCFSHERKSIGALQPTTTTKNPPKSHS
jgi:IS605 OrfB family transposase